MKAEQEEKDRRQRLLEIEKEEEEEAKKLNEDEKDGEKKGVEKTGLVLQREPRVAVDYRIARRLKEHQNGGVKFMFANMVERVDRSKSRDWQGCILAHCMGLGKTIQTLSFLQAVLCS